MAAIYSNEMLNVRVRYETLYRVNLNDNVSKEGVSFTLGELLRKQQANEVKLFLAAEQGMGKAENDVLVVINPKVKSKALRWLIEEYPSVLFQGS